MKLSSLYKDYRLYNRTSPPPFVPTCLLGPKSAPGGWGKPRTDWMRCMEEKWAGKLHCASRTPCVNGMTCRI